MEFIILLTVGVLLYYIGKSCYFYPIQKKEINRLLNQIKELENDKKKLMKSCSKYEKIIGSNTPFTIVADMYADVQVIVYEEAEHRLRTKNRPAFKASEEISMFRKKTKEYLSQYKEMYYKYDFLLKTFPELKKYVDDCDALKSLQYNNSYSEFIENRDATIDYLSIDEWKSLSVEARNQLALDRYKLKNKSNWIIGIEYEMYIDYLLRSSGYKTIPNGSIKGLEDLGRDIIAFKTDKNGQNVVYIIQCKNWASNKELHENVVCQIFGTSIEYIIKHKGEMFLKVVPVIYTTVPLSEMANKFAEALKVIVRVVKKGEFPMIKCNIGNDGRKIYHLPYDQQYYKAEIKKPGEFYAWTVKEAVDTGFRRAFKYNGIKSNQQ